jgi:hypothetical protein
MGLALREKRMAATVALNFERLNVLDDVWTNYVVVAGATRISREDVKSLEGLVREIEEGLDVCNRHIDWLADLQAKHGPTINKCWEGAISTACKSTHGNAVVARSFAVLSKWGPLLRAIEASPVLNACGIRTQSAFGPSHSITAIAKVFGQVQSAKADMRAKLCIIQAGGHTLGDLPKSIKCGISLGTALGCALAGVVPGFIAAMGSALITCGEMGEDEIDAPGESGFVPDPHPGPDPYSPIPDGHSGPGP